MHRLSTPLTRLTVVVATLLSPAATIAAIVAATGTATAATKDRLGAQDGVSNVVVTALLAGIGALIVVAYMAIVRTKAISEANNLPSSSG